MMTTSIKLAAAAAIVAGVAGLAGAPASAAPTLDPGVARTSDQSAVRPESVRWVCGPYRCWWRPGPPVGFYGPRPWVGPGWGWRGPGWGPGWGRPGWGRPGWGPGWGRPGWGPGWGPRPGWRRW